MKKSISALICVIFLATVFMFAGCSNNSNNNYSKDAHTITIYRGRESGMVDGTYDNDVKQAIEKKFLDDTGIEINLVVKLYNSEDLGTTVEKQWGQTKVDLDGVIHYLGEDGSVLLKYAKTEDTVLDAGSLLEEYGQNILKNIRLNDNNNIAERSGYIPMSSGYKMNIIPSVNNEKQYGIIVRKDFMQELYDAGKISTDPEEYDVLNDGYKNMSITDFNTLLYKMKDINAMRYPIMGKAWDLNRVLGSVFETDLYSTMYDEGTGTYVPTQFTQGTADFMNTMWTWAKDKVWENESATTSDSTRLNYFVNGWSGVYVTYPNVTNLISAARTLKATDSSADFMMIAPLADESGEVRGYQKVQKAFYGLMLPYKANDAEVLVQYIDWLYSDADNYELALYGIKGTHWVDGDDFTLNSNVYKTWQYPASKTDEFNQTSPYSGLYCLLPNTNVSNRVRGDYDFTEKSWFSLCTDTFESYSENRAEGVWIQEPVAGSKVANAYKITENEFTTSVRGYCWAGTGSSDMYTLLDTYKKYVKSNCQEYLTFLDTSIKASVSYFKENLK